MTQLLTSVKNVEESLLAMYAGANIIDLKDPAVGALGALSIDLSKQILAALDADILTSATVGEGHSSIEKLTADIKQYAQIGVDVVKISVSELFLNQQFFVEIQQLTLRGIKLVAVFFADKSIDLSLLATLQAAGFYGAMMDTQQKARPLLDVQSMHSLSEFTRMCRDCGLISGLAGSVSKQHINTLLTLKPDFIGMRGGICHEGNRTSSLSREKVEEVSLMLLNYNRSKRAGGCYTGSGLQI